MENNIFVSQQELAVIFGVNRTTVRAWSSQGLPCIEGGKGKSHMYHPGICMWWRKGRQYAEVYGINDLSASQLIALARTQIGEDEQALNVECFVDYLAIIGIGEEEARSSFHFVNGIVNGFGLAADIARKSQAEFTNGLAHAKV